MASINGYNGSVTYNGQNSLERLWELESLLEHERNKVNNYWQDAKNALANGTARPKRNYEDRVQKYSSAYFAYDTAINYLRQLVEQEEKIEKEEKILREHTY